MAKPIVKFRGQHWFLSNFYPVIITYQDHKFFTAEHAYHSAKATCKDDFDFIRTGRGPADALHRSRRVAHREDWDDIKLQVMHDVLMEKFRLPRMRLLLQETGSRAIIEGNDWNECFWGVCDGRGENHLGKILMQIRRELCG